MKNKLSKKHIILLISIIFSIFNITEVKAVDILSSDMTVTEKQKTYCLYEYNGAQVYYVDENGALVNHENIGNNYSITCPEMYNKYRSDAIKFFYKNSTFNCPALDVFTKDGIVSDKIYFAPTSVMSIEGWKKEKSLLSGTLKTSTTHCLYEIAVPNSNDKLQFEAAMYLTSKDFAGLYKISSNISSLKVSKNVKTGSNWQNNDGSLVCRDDLVVDFLEKNNGKYKVYVRTNDEEMMKNSQYSSNPGVLKIVGKEDDRSYEIKYLSNICNDNQKVRRIFRLLGYALLIVKILVPLGLIGFGAIDFTKTVLSGDSENLLKTARSFGFKAIAALIVFFLPTIINLILNLVDDSTKGTGDYVKCKTCIFSPKDCK